MKIKFGSDKKLQSASHTIGALLTRKRLMKVLHRTFDTHSATDKLETRLAHTLAEVPPKVLEALFHDIYMIREHALTFGFGFGYIWAHEDRDAKTFLGARLPTVVTKELAKRRAKRSAAKRASK